MSKIKNLINGLQKEFLQRGLRVDIPTEGSTSYKTYRRKKSHKMSRRNLLVDDVVLVKNETYPVVLDGREIGYVSFLTKTTSSTNKFLLDIL
jgi:hypothetical protein